MPYDNFITTGGESAILAEINLDNESTELSKDEGSSVICLADSKYGVVSCINQTYV